MPFPNEGDIMQDAIKAYYEVKLANETGLTVAQVRTLNALEAGHNQVSGSDEFRYSWSFDPFKVEMDDRLNLPRVSYLDSEHGWPSDAVVLADGKLDFKL